MSAKSQTPLVALVVDDSMLIRHTVCRFLEERGYTVESATNGEEALPIVNRIHPDIIITDMQMPKMTGTELITALKAQPETAKIPIVIVAERIAGSTPRNTGPISPSSRTLILKRSSRKLSRRCWEAALRELKPQQSRAGIGN